MTRKASGLIGAGVLAAVVAAGGVVATSSGKHPTSAAQEAPPNTVKVEMRTLSAMVSLDGTLTYGAGSDGLPYSVINRVSGTYTKLPQLGQVISQGQVLYRVDDSPVVLLYGSTPAYRSLSAGASGADVAQLNADLVALGYATIAQLTPTSSFFGSATTASLENLQAALGVTPNGTLTLGQAVFEPTAVRVTTLSAQLGASSQTGETVMQGSSTARQVQVAVNASQQTDVAAGDNVTITLPDNQTTAGVVSSVGTVASCPSNSGSSSGSGSSSRAADTCSSGTSGSSTTPSITVYVTPSVPDATGSWDQAPVQVTITTASLPSALVVPVTALLAHSGGGYAIEVVDAQGTHHLVEVSLGLFDDADGLVQITGSGVAAGEEVAVPAT